MAHEIRIKRVYEPPAAEDGARILVDRVWPRGLTKEAAHIDAWDKDVAPSTELRKWFGHDPARWDEFRRRYEAELAGNERLAELAEKARAADITLVYGARDTEHNQAVVLREVLLKALPL
ncbi:MAG: DUF488 domain-containing protein [Anaerolineae bacterium]